MQNSVYILLLLFSVFISAISQILLKKSALEEHKSFIFEYLNWKVVTAYIIFFIAVAIDLITLKHISVSLVPVIQTSSYIFIIIMSRLIFKEKISKQQFAGIFLIITGILIFVM